jgi:hypothetical protein
MSVRARRTEPHPRAHRVPDIRASSPFVRHHEVNWPPVWPYPLIVLGQKPSARIEITNDDHASSQVSSAAALGSVAGFATRTGISSRNAVAYRRGATDRKFVFKSAESGQYRKRDTRQ